MCAQPDGNCAGERGRGPDRSAYRVRAKLGISALHAEMKLRAPVPAIGLGSRLFEDRRQAPQPPHPISSSGR